MAHAVSGLASGVHQASEATHFRRYRDRHDARDAAEFNHQPIARDAVDLTQIVACTLGDAEAEHQRFGKVKTVGMMISTFAEPNPPAVMIKLSEYDRIGGRRTTRLISSAARAHEGRSQAAE